MAKNVQIKRYDGSTWEEINPKTKAELVSLSGEIAGYNDVQEAIDSMYEGMVWQSERGAAGGIAELDSNKKIKVAQLPDYILGQLLYGGNIANTGIATISDKLKSKLGITDTTIKLVNSASDNKTTVPKQYGYKTLEGVYFIASGSGTVVGQTLVTGDWLLSTGSAWTKIDNTDAVTSVNGQTGAVYLYGNNIMMEDEAAAETLKEAIDSKITNPGNSGENKYLGTNAAGGIEWLNVPADINTWRAIKVSGNAFLGNGTDTGDLNLAAGSGLGVSTETSTKTVRYGLKVASTDDLGGFKAGAVTAADVDDNTPTTEVANRHYFVRIEGGHHGYVNVPWIQYSAGSGISLNTTTNAFSLNIPVQAADPSTGVEGAIYYQLV